MSMQAKKQVLIAVTCPHTQRPRALRLPSQPLLQEELGISTDLHPSFVMLVLRPTLTLQQHSKVPIDEPKVPRI